MGKFYVKAGGNMHVINTDHTSNLYRALAIFDADCSIIDHFLLEDFSNHLARIGLFTREEGDAVVEAYRRKSEPKKRLPKNIQEEIQGIESYRLDIMKAFSQSLTGKKANDVRKEAANFMQLRYTDRFPYEGATVRAFRDRGYRTILLGSGPAAVMEPFVDDLNFEQINVYSSPFEVDKNGCFTGISDPVVEAERKMELVERIAKEEGAKLGLSAVLVDCVTQLPVLQNVGIAYIVRDVPRLDPLIKPGWIFCEHDDILFLQVLETLPKVKLRYDDRDKILGIVSKFLPDLTKDKLENND